MEWKPIETAPKYDGAFVDLYDLDSRWPNMHWDDETGKWWNDYHTMDVEPQDVTHWMRVGKPVSINTPQPAPKPSNHPAAWDLVMSDMRERDKIGTAKYGQRLTPHDGRNSLVDAYQEVLDLAVYLRKAIYESYETL